ncbi:YdcH family protein [Sphaerotilus natans]|jgi:hypothetical protein|uniref:DUF465 domain-containing protein n=1 Tax=Sphaerotilus natans subsp. natans DSM 6575 TaxID=1286631 RepID=A0A059KMU3_9BURK|nr:YdcH family protein [Sphaerotilus natans]KDB52428.1 hypothetical protein X805_20430 [Sphaerotilus natans subsp. natans DSM 6575]SIR71359.1 hypothetical protein SAMN05421778_11524 [Sphaerotilus natans]
MNDNLHSPQRRLIELRIEHADLDSLIDGIVHRVPIDELMLRRLKKRRLALRDMIARLERMLDPPEPA